MIIKKNLAKFKNDDKIREILDTAKIIKSQRQPQKSEKNTHLLYIRRKHNTRGYQMQ